MNNLLFIVVAYIATTLGCIKLMDKYGANTLILIILTIVVVLTAIEIVLIM